MNGWARRVVWPALLLVAFHGVCIWIAFSNSPVNDEFAAHITGGYLYWKTGVFAGGVDNPPLGQLWLAAPLVLTGQPLAPFAATGLILARWTNILLATTLLFWVFRESSRLYGFRGGMIALLAGVLDPNFLANASLATLEIPITLCIWGSIVLSIRFLRSPRFRNVLGVAVLSGLSAATKVTALYIPVVVLAILFVMLCYAAGRRHFRRCVRAGSHHPLILAGYIVATFVLPLLIIGAAYGFQNMQLFPPLPGGFIDATLGKFEYARAGNVAFLLGESKTGGWWWYYPVVFAIKTPIMWILGLVVSLGLLSRRMRLSVLMYLVFPVVYIVLAIATNRAQIGLRHLMPMYPFLFLLFGELGRVNRKGLITLGVGAGITIVSLFRALPWPITYENLAASQQGYRWLADANYDWGQSNDAIDEYLQDHPDVIRPTAHVPAPGRYVIRVNHLDGFGLIDGDSYAWLRPFEPVDRVARAGLIYELTEEDSEVFLQNADQSAEWCVYTAEWLRNVEGQDAGLEQLGRCLEEEDYTVQALRARARWHETSGEMLQAYRDLRRASLLDPDDNELARDFEILETGMKLDKLAERRPGEAKLQRVGYLNAQVRPAEALELLRGLEEEGVPARLTAGGRYWTLCLLGEWEEALQISRDFAESVPGGVGAPPPALIEEALEGDGGNEEALLDLGMYAFQMKRWDAAASLYLGVLRRDPGNETAASYLGQIVVLYVEEGETMPEEMRKSLEPLEFNPRQIPSGE